MDLLSCFIQGICFRMIFKAKHLILNHYKNSNKDFSGVQMFSISQLNAIWMDLKAGIEQSGRSLVTQKLSFQVTFGLRIVDFKNSFNHAKKSIEYI